MEFLLGYGLFLAKAITVVVVVVGLLLLVKGINHRGESSTGSIKVTDLSEKHQNTLSELEEHLFDTDYLKAREKLTKKEKKQKEKEQQKELKHALKNGKLEKKRPAYLFVLNFKGSIDAKEVNSLREEITAVLTVATAQDKVLLCLESGGGMVHGYGLAASQLLRLKNANIPLTVAVDKVAASGGYMMACVADKIVSAPFAILGSIGVIAQVPNFNKLLKKNDIDFEQITAGEYKRTLTMFGENTDKGREKFKEEIEETHGLFKEFVSQFRPSLDLEKVATGEHWFGSKAKELGLVDEISTSDELIVKACAEQKVVAISFEEKKKLKQKLGGFAAEITDNVVTKLVEKARAPFV